eukprot:1767569-Lingulodinium_polyedra.AAC.1
MGQSAPGTVSAAVVSVWGPLREAGGRAPRGWPRVGHRDQSWHLAFGCRQGARAVFAGVCAAAAPA